MTDIITENSSPSIRINMEENFGRINLEGNSECTHRRIFSDSKIDGMILVD